MTELMVTLAIAAILAAIAVPAMQDFIAAKAVEAQTQELAASLRLARSEALKRGMEVSICGASAANASACSGAATGWINGWVVFYDRNVIGTLDGDDGVIRVQSAASKGVSAVNTAAVSLTFRRNGLLLAGGGVPMVLLPKSGSSATAARTVCVNSQGRVSVSKGSLTVCP